jgi:cytochrome c551/c552
MNRLMAILGAGLVLGLVGTAALPTLGVNPVVANAADADGKAVFMDQKCDMCHDVSTVGITATTKSEKIKGPDLVNLKQDAEWMAQYLKKEVDLEGKKHSKAYKGDDAALNAMVSWMLAQKSN